MIWKNMKRGAEITNLPGGDVLRGQQHGGTDRLSPERLFRRHIACKVLLALFSRTLAASKL
jgi:hypothetical protein